jgi:hypothetical protein
VILQSLFEIISLLQTILFQHSGSFKNQFSKESFGCNQHHSRNTLFTSPLDLNFCFLSSLSVTQTVGSDHETNHDYKVKGKGKVVPVLFFNWAPHHESVLREWRYRSTHSLTSALDGREWSASRPGRFTPRERAPGTHWIRGWVGPRAVLDMVVKRKIPSLNYISAFTVR